MNNCHKHVSVCKDMSPSILGPHGRFANVLNLSSMRSYLPGNFSTNMER